MGENNIFGGETTKQSLISSISLKYCPNKAQLARKSESWQILVLVFARKIPLPFDYLKLRRRKGFASLRKNLNNIFITINDKKTTFGRFQNSPTSCYFYNRKNSFSTTPTYLQMKVIFPTMKDIFPTYRWRISFQPTDEEYLSYLEMKDIFPT